MKKFTKFMLSVAAVTAVSATMAVAAMAADTVTGTYDPATGNVALDGVVSSGDQQTLLVLTEDADTVTEAIIAQIDQDASISQFVLPAALTEGTYYIRIGGTDGTIQKGTLTISGGSGEVETITILFGNIDGDDWDLIDADDVTALAKWTVDMFGDFNAIVGTEYNVVSGTTAETIDFGNIDQDEWGLVDADDVTALAQWTVDMFNDSNSLVNTEIVVEAAK